MSLKTKTFVILGIIFLAAILATLYLGYVQIHPILVEMENEMARRDLDRARQSIGREIYHIDNIVHDWAAWDEAYKYLQKPEIEMSPEELFKSTFFNNRLNVIYAIDMKGEVVWGGAFELDTGKPIEIERFSSGRWGEDSPFLDFDGIDDNVTAIVPAEAGPLLLASRPVVTSQHEGPIIGALIMGRFLTDDLIAELGGQAGVELEVRQLSGPEASKEAMAIARGISTSGPYLIEELDDNWLLVHGVMPGIGGEPAALVSVKSRRALAEIRHDARESFFVVIILVLLATLLAIILLLDRYVLKPLTLLSGTVSGVSKTSDLSTRLEVKSGDELGRLSADINKMLGTIESTHKALAAREDQLRLFVENSPAAVAMLDRGLECLLVSKVWAETFGPAEESAEGRCLSDILTAPGEELSRALDSALEGEASSMEEDLLRFSDGRSEWVAWEVQPWRGRGGEVGGAIVFIQVITQRKRAEAELSDHRDRLEQLVSERTLALEEANAALEKQIEERERMEEELLKARKLESIGVLAGGIAHDFNNILTAIMGYVSLASYNTGDPAEVAAFLKEAEKGAARAKDLTRQLLTFARGGAPVKTTSSIKDLIEDTASFALRGSNVKHHFHPAPGLWTAEIDEGQISQVIGNLVINADQAMPEGGTITVAAENVEIEHGREVPLDPGRYIMIKVRDSGVGISEKHLEKIFDPYFTTKQKGTGLGLATSYSIVKRHGGHISVESEVDKGTVFTIHLPASDKPAENGKAPGPASLAGEGLVLVMDDDAAIRKLASEMLRSLGYGVRTANDGSEAARLYKEKMREDEPFAAAVLDLTVPGGMGGKGAAEAILEADPDARLIVTSGYSTDPVMAEFESHGFRARVPKPFQLGELGQALKSAIKG